MDHHHQGHVMTIANSIIGVSILAMPFCFKQCGIILSIVLLCISSVISRLSCHFLLKSAIISRLRTFEFLAYHAFGSFGKFIVEIGLIGFLMGTCIAFFVVMGELAPGIIAEMTNIQATSTLRNVILIMLALFCVLPLGLLHKVDSLSGVCTATIGFYITLVLKVIFESLPHIYQSDWMDKVEYWKPSGILQCLPIFSMALFCQTQLFEIYQAIPNASLEKMNNLIRVAVNICTSVYILVGMFGYIALSHQISFTGNILLSFQPSVVTDLMKIGFVLSIAFSFPLIIFPCRASLYSLLYKRVHDGSNNYIPERKFKILTITIVLVSLLVGVLIPNIELVLGLVGSTIGVMICVIFPATCFICILSKNTNERLLAQLMLFTGIIVMVLGTYANLYAFEEVSHTTEKTVTLLKINEKDLMSNELFIVKPPTTIKTLINSLDDEQPKQIRHEPPQPEEPVELPVIINADIPPAKEIAMEKLLKDDTLNVSQKPLIIEPNNKQQNKVDEVDVEAIKKEEKEIREVEKLNEDKGKDTLKNEVNKKLDQFQKQINELKINQENEIKVNEKKLKTFKEIELLARKAIETLTNDVSNKKADSTLAKDQNANDAMTKEDVAEAPQIESKVEDVSARRDVVANAKIESNKVVDVAEEKESTVEETEMRSAKNSKVINSQELVKNVPLVKPYESGAKLTKILNQVQINDANKVQAINKADGSLTKENDLKNIVIEKPERENNLLKAQPLSYQLGLNKNVINIDPKIYVKDMLPIPLAGTNYSKILLNNNNNNQSNVDNLILTDQMKTSNMNEQIKEEFAKEDVEQSANVAEETNKEQNEKKDNFAIQVDNKSSANKYTETNNEQSAKKIVDDTVQKVMIEQNNKMDDNLQSIRRDILSNDRQKRDTISEIKLDDDDEDDEHCKKKTSISKTEEGAL